MRAPRGFSGHKWYFGLDLEQFAGRVTSSGRYATTSRTSTSISAQFAGRGTSSDVGDHDPAPNARKFSDNDVLAPVDLDEAEFRGHTSRGRVVLGGAPHGRHATRNQLSDDERGGRRRKSLISVGLE